MDSCHNRLALSRALAVTMSFRMTAVMATFAGFPMVMRCVYFALMSGLKRAATRADVHPILPAPPLGDRLGVDAVPLGENPQALLTILYCSTASGLGDAPHLLRTSPAVVLALP
jgi:hypothetical protein